MHQGKDLGVPVRRIQKARTLGPVVACRFCVGGYLCSGHRTAPSSPNLEKLHTHLLPLPREMLTSESLQAISEQPVHA